ncbi:MAG: tRNA (adenosine(37)-N6)-threonylcarbamoyltransferase complex dimerization subunit type 1 TsaB [Flavobacteriales bacterium]|nr:tRNA (adenosine(37)-N6)-threonylcarbamoyltransferase complex dimerization subunit type 1 TsaB [Flavobacteriales bacterium]
MPLILALETATKLCSVALSRDGVVVAVRELESDALVHAEKLNVFVAEVMAKAGTTFSELDAVAVGIGPGSYTGLRIGLSAAKGLCFALDIPIIGISTLRTLVEQGQGDRRAGRTAAMAHGGCPTHGGIHPTARCSRCRHGAIKSLGVGCGMGGRASPMRRVRGWRGQGSGVLEHSTGCDLRSRNSTDSCGNGCGGGAEVHSRGIR